jgi:heptose I phosphotransferase
VAAAAGEFIGPWGRLQSFIAVEELSGMLPLHEAIPVAGRLPAAVFRAWKRGLIAEMVRVVHAFHRRRWFHKDLYLCHFYIAREDAERLPEWRGRVHLIDWHRAEHHPWTWAWWQAKDLGQLLFASDLAEVTARDRLWFWRLYQESDRRSRFLRPWIQLRAWSYHRHERRRLARAQIRHRHDRRESGASAA